MRLEHIFAALALKQDGVDALEVQQLRQQQARRAAADNADLRFHGSFLRLVWDVVPHGRILADGAPRGMDQADFVLYKSNMPRAPLQPAIRSYNLFGEVHDLPDVVHCETIAARSVLHDWEFAAHRHARLHQVLLIARGGGRATLEGKTHRLRPMTAVNVPAGQVHGFSFTPGHARLGGDLAERISRRGADAVGGPQPGAWPNPPCCAARRTCAD